MKRIQVIFLIFILLTTYLYPLANPPKAHALTRFTEAFVRLDRVKASTTTGGTVCAKPSNATAPQGAEADVQVTFPTGFTVNTTAANWTVTTTNLPLGATPWIGIGTATAVSGQVVTFASGDLTSATTLYCFNFAAASTLTNPTAANSLTGTIKTRSSGAVIIMQQDYALSIISEDKISLTASVSATLTLAYDYDDDGTGFDVFTTSLSSGTVSITDNTTVTVSTNASLGYVLWVKSLNAALTSPTVSESITSPGTIDDVPTTITGTTEGYVLDTNLITDSATGDCTAAVDAEYLGTASVSGGTLTANFNEIASCTAGGTTNGDVYDLLLYANPSAVRASADDYNDSLTVVGTGRF